MRRFDEAPNLYARMGGFAYLAIILLGAFGELYVRGALVAPGDGQATVANISNAPLLWRAGLAGDLLMHVLDLPLLVLFYLLLRPVSRGLALTATLFNVIQTAVLVTNKLTLFPPLLLASGSSGASPFAQLPPATLGAIAALAAAMHGQGFGLGLIFFGISCVIRGYLIFQSAFLPRTLGVLLAAAGLSYLGNSAALLLAPDLAGALFPWVLLPALVGELALSFWLIVRGIDVEAWTKRASA
jgi:hypothetical protein